MDLPPELRVSIYTYAFEDSSDALVELGEIRNHLPSTSLTAVSRLVRQETLPCFEAAYTKFWNCHMIHVVGWTLAEAGVQARRDDENIYSEKHQAVIEQLPAPRGLVGRLAFQIGPAKLGSKGDSVSQVVAARNHENVIQFSSDTETDIRLIADSTELLPMLVRRLWGDNSVSLARDCSMTYSEDQSRDPEQVLDVKACIRAVLQVFVA